MLNRSVTLTVGMGRRRMPPLLPPALRAAPSFGVVLPTFPQSDNADWRGLGTWSSRAEDAGASALWACDHLFWPTPALECVVALSVAAASTTNAALGAGVVQVPLRRPAVLAKQAASLQVLSEGRLVFGVGVGQHEGEYAEARVAFENRGLALENGLEEMRRHWQLSQGAYPMLPVPPPIPVWIGGSKPVSRRRAARTGDGWIPLFVPPHRLRDEFLLLADDARGAGRDPAAIARAAVVFVSVGRFPEARDRGLRWLSSLYGLPEPRFARHLVAGEPARCAEELSAYVEAGAEHLALFLADDDPLPQFEPLIAELHANVRA